MIRNAMMLSVLLAAGLVTMDAAAHSVLTSPEPRWTGMAGSGLKERHCGQGPGELRSNTITNFQAGQTITVTWQETIPHPGYWRISFDADGWDFVDPPTPRATGYSSTVLADVIYPSTPAEASQRWGKDNFYSYEITLPDVTCDNCTLQLIQFMEDKLSDGNPDNDIYYSCADLVLVRATADEGQSPEDLARPDASLAEVYHGNPDQGPGDAGSDTAIGVADPGTVETGTTGDAGNDLSTGNAEPDGGTANSGGSCTAGGSPSGGSWLALLLMLSLLALTRRIRSV
jgi:MYXO-CTERM domain-containing protein